MKTMYVCTCTVLLKLSYFKLPLVTSSVPPKARKSDLPTPFRIDVVVVKLGLDNITVFSHDIS